MRALCFLALFWCVPVNAATLPEAVAQQLAMIDKHSENFFQSASRYLSPRMQVSGSSEQNSERAKGRLNLAGESILWRSHDIALDYRDSVSRHNGVESKKLRFRYSFPLAGSNLNLTVRNSDYAGVVERSGVRQDAYGDYERITLSGSRRFWSWQGVDINSVFRHSAGKKSAYEDSEWVSDSSYRLSSFGLRCSEQKSLRGGFVAGTQITALGGREHRESVTRTGTTTDHTRFHKISVAASLNRSIYHWDMNLKGRYQFADDDLVSSENLQIAGPSMMKGFNGQSLSVSEGGWMRFDARSPDYTVPFMGSANSSVVFSLLRGWAPASGARKDGVHASTGEIALELQGQSFEARMSVGRVLNVSGPVFEKPSRPDVSLSMSMAI